MSINLWNEYLKLKEQNAHFYVYDAAKVLNSSEGNIMLHAPDVVYLGENVRDILLKLETLGPILSIVRNEQAVSEKVAIYNNLKVTSKMGLAINVGGIDVRIFTEKWFCALAVSAVNGRGKLNRSIQFYDHHGLAVQKIFLTEDSDVSAWEAIVAEFKSDAQPEFKPAEVEEKNRATQLSAEDLDAYRQDWLKIKDVHQFYGLRQKYNLSTIKAYELAPEGYSFHLPPQAIENIYSEAAKNKVPLITFIGNRAIIQIQTGIVHHLKRMSDWLNIFDSKETNFTMHLKDSEITDVWLVTRPTRDCNVSSLVGFDKEGDIVLSIFGQRIEGEQELASWREILSTVSAQTLAKDPQ